MQASFQRIESQAGHMVIELVITLGMLIPPLLLVLGLLGNYLQQSQQKDILARHAFVLQPFDQPFELGASTELLVSELQQH